MTRIERSARTLPVGCPVDDTVTRDVMTINASRSDLQLQVFQDLNQKRVIFVCLSMSDIGRYGNRTICVATCGLSTLKCSLPRATVCLVSNR